jgi:HK97 gp10 family phage protein
MTAMVKIRFTQDRVVQDGDQGTPHETRFSAGQVVDLTEASAAHWLSRGAAERVLLAEEPAMSTAGAGSTVEVVIGPHDGAFYASLVEFGTQHSSPKPFLRPAWDAGKMQVLDGVGDDMWAEIKKALARQARRLAKAAKR